MLFIDCLNWEDWDKSVKIPIFGGCDELYHLSKIQRELWDIAAQNNGWTEFHLNYFDPNLG